MSTASSITTTLGAGSGINMAQLASDLAAAQFGARKARIDSRVEQNDAKISVASQLRSSISALATSFGDRIRTGDLAQKATVSGSGVATATLAQSVVAKGAYSLEVSSLAKSQTLASQAFGDAAATVGSGSLTFRFGKVSGGAFTEDAGKEALTISVAEGASLKEIASSINSQNKGVTAYIANTGAGAQLVFKGLEGAANGFVVEAVEDAPGTGLAKLAWEATGGDPLRLTQGSSDAAFKLDGLEMTSATNKTGQVAPGLTLNLTGTNVGNPSTISFSDNTANLSSVMQDLVGAMNELSTLVRDATNPLGGGELNSDPGARALKSQLSSITTLVMMPNAASGEPKTLSDLGVKIERNGSYSIDSAKLGAVLSENPEAVSAMFTTGLYGIYSSFDKINRSASAISDPGSLAGSIKRYEDLSSKLTSESAKLDEKQETLRQQMVARFAKTDARVAASQSTLSFLRSQIDAWNSSNN
ncbi:flagellar filament capping protein FliD [Qipengyuania sp.]|uniref:flagellar filament capping protein FliD n=1 Tax=Qipengyuania sp. TaxID=2004515 RepID=UPI0035C844F1